MGSVSSLVTGNHSLSVAKPCRAPGQPRLKKESGSEQRRSGGCSLDDLLKCSFSPGSSSFPSRGLSHSRSGRSEDFFYIKVSQKPRSKQHRGSAMEESDSNTDEETTPKLLYRTLADRTSSEQPLVRAFTPGVSTETGHKSLDSILSTRDKSPDTHRAENLSGTLSDSGRNSMSSLPTHSTGSSLGPVSQRDGLGKGLLPPLPSWLNGSNVSPDSRCSPSFYSPASRPSVGTSESPRSTETPPGLLSGTTGGIRSPITADDSLIERLELRLVEREGELQRLQMGLEEKGAEACQRFEERQRRSVDESEGLKQSRIQQSANRSAQGLQLQVSKLQEEKQRLEDHVLRLTQEKELMEMRLRAYETHSALSPTLEETQWEVCQKSGEIFLLKQQLRDSQADVSHKVNEVLSLRALLKDVSAKMETCERQSRDREDELLSRTREAEVCQNELQRKKNEADLLREKVCRLESDNEQLKQEQGTPRPPSSPCLQEEVDTLRQQVQLERDAKDKLSSGFEQERQTWNKEKEKVIKYQKQLQMNYLQMHKKNRELERTLREVTAELEAKTELTTEMSYCSALQTYEDVIATEI